LEQEGLQNLQIIYLFFWKRNFVFQTNELLQTIKSHLLGTHQYMLGWKNITSLWYWITVSGFEIR